MSCNVVPDKGTEYALTYTIPDFETKLLAQWDKDFKNNPSYLTKKFDLFHSCLQHVAATKWDLCTNKYGGNRRTKADFDESICIYLEAVAKRMNLGDKVICWLCLRSKPGEHAI